MDRVSTSSILQDMAQNGSYILREPTAKPPRTVLINGSVETDLTGCDAMINDLLAASYIAASAEAKPSLGAETYRVTEDGRRAASR